MKAKLSGLFKLFICLLYVQVANAQGKSIVTSVGDPAPYIPHSGVRGALLGSLIYPGFSLGVERPFKYTEIIKIKGDQVRVSYRERYLAYSLAMYYQANYHTNIFTQAELVRRRQKAKGYYWESSLGLGVSRTFVDGPAFTVDDDGTIKQVPLSGNWFALGSLGAAVGYNASLVKQKPYSLFVKHQWLFLFPYNAFLLPRPTLELGINYHILSEIGKSPRYIYREKTRN